MKYFIFGFIWAVVDLAIIGFFYCAIERGDRE